MTVALTAGGVPTPADLDALTASFFAGQKLRASQLAEVETYTAGDAVRQSHFPDVDDD